ncbi:Crp/Fnr family transcriptional regulator [Seonamhaeicola marinus]|uniref:Crp/Fnr family transcriptional regulator n=1 Tax=Seonamhaeicola marinus TaxID=1912246 RepID=A0A5D0HKM7_9FLAO|nr:Crp/Fnr family transcriptional regulator [Seonamhaeicola marinus]TYA71815.1 Crp/Fnr family transcriptional regulator [Seonamhaeicola marinus]
MHQNYEYLKKFADISEETFNEIAEITEFKRIEAGTQIVKLGEVPTKIYMLVSGFMRCYLTTESGKEYNKSFYLPISFIGSLTALLSNKPSMLVFEALSDCKLYEIDYKKFKGICERNIKLNTLHSKVLEYVYVKYEKRLIELMSLDATERYLALKKEIPDVDEKIPQYQIASYLGITAVQLSRIRKKIDSN